MERKLEEIRTERGFHVSSYANGPVELFHVIDLVLLSRAPEVHARSDDNDRLSPVDSLNKGTLQSAFNYGQYANFRLL